MRPPPPEVIQDIGYAADIVPGSAEFEVLPAAAQALLIANPDVQTAVIDGRLAAFYGAPLATGATAAEAEQAFWTTHGDAFGVANLDLTMTRSHDVGFGRMTVFAYQQRIDGLPVEFGTARLVVSHDSDNAVTLVSGRFVNSPPEGLSDVFITPENAIGIVAGSPSFSYFQNWSTPELVVFAGTPEAFGWPRAGHPVKAWKFQADFEGEQTPFQAVTFYVDASNGEILHASKDTLNADLVGHVRARATPVTRLGLPWSGPYDPADPLTLDANISVPEILVRVSPGGTPSDYTDFSGDFVIPDWTGGTTAMTISVDDGQWFDVDPATGGPPLTDSETVDPGVAEDFFLNEASWTRETVAQVNALIYAAQTRKFYTDRMSFVGLNHRLKLVTSAGSSPALCNAGYGRYTLTFLRAGFDGGGNFCPDYAYSAVVAHEYGHFVHNQLGALGFAFGEGFGDCTALLLFDDPNLNRGGPGGRDYSPGQPEISYPCSGEGHHCGQVLGGLFRDIREKLSQTFDPTAPMTDETALKFTRDLFVDWAQLTNGGYGSQSAHPLTVKEIYAAASPLSVQYGFNFTAQIKPRICEAAFQHGLATHFFPGPICVAKPVPTGSGPFISFRPAQIVYANGAGVNPYGIAVGLIDGDTLNDVVLACEQSGNVLVYWGVSSPGSFTFEPTPTSIVVQPGGRPTKVAIANLDADQYVDLVVTLPGLGMTGGLDQVQILRQTSNRSFTPVTPLLNPVDNATPQLPILRPVGLTVGDWDTDGDPDIAVAGYVAAASNLATLGLFWNNGALSFTATGRRSVDPNDPMLDAIGNGFDLAGWKEDAFGNPGTTYAMFAMTNDHATYTPPNPPAPLHFFRSSAQGSQSLNRFSFGAAKSQTVTNVQIDDDTLIDVASSVNLTSPARTWWYRRTAVDVLQQVSGDDNAITDLSPRGVAAGRLSQATTSGGGTAPDARFDLVVATVPSNVFDETFSLAVTLFVNSGQSGVGRFEYNSLPVSPNPYDQPFPRQVVVIDLDGDGRSDIVTANRGASGSTADAVEGFSWRPNR